MAFDEILAARVRDILIGLGSFEERKMFGGHRPTRGLKPQAANLSTFLSAGAEYATVSWDREERRGGSEFGARIT